MGRRREGRTAKVGEIGKWDGVIPAEHWLWSQGGSLVRVDVQIVPDAISKVSLKQLLTIQWCHRKPGGEGKVLLKPSGRLSYQRMPSFVWAELLSISCRVWINGRVPHPFLLLSRGAAGLLRQVKKCQ